MRYSHRFLVEAQVAAVEKFHRRPVSLAALTPPPVFIRDIDAPDLLSTGDHMRFTMWLGFLPVKWEAQIAENEQGLGFVDQQVYGPFHTWIHNHTFVPVDSSTTEIVDEVKVALHKTNRLWQAVGFCLWLGLPFLFAYRGWQTRRLIT